MSRSQRLFDLLQLFRCHKYPVSAEHLADKLNVSVRTIYRDIATLQAQGADIQGEAGVGYILKPTFTLPPLMFSTSELEALLLGASWIAKQGDDEFENAAKNAIAKISAVLPPDHKAKFSEDVFRVASVQEEVVKNGRLTEIKHAIKQQHRAKIHYLDLKNNRSERVIWPLLVGLFQQHRVLVAWCENKDAFRHFRLDRIEQWHSYEDSYSVDRRVLIKQWQQEQGISDMDIRY
ncbi:helix-turn-helix transcriptional regulator [Vibrio hepatarius]|uniref:helix-turn-helix transcriptional regulator n=1 Tax=Vibrio hepatarius TaxID=171383 RepID=UPI00148C0523|nr:YafY family protein [Vibrio hepatarius]NOI14257.1 YafY family transcriptional regulator [Vibrio hepatarius]